MTIRDPKKPTRINQRAFELLMEEKKRLGTKTISETIIQALEDRKDPSRQELIRILDKARELVVQ